MSSFPTLVAPLSSRTSAATAEEGAKQYRNWLLASWGKILKRPKTDSPFDVVFNAVTATDRHISQIRSKTINKRTYFIECPDLLTLLFYYFIVSELKHIGWNKILRFSHVFADQKTRYPGFSPHRKLLFAYFFSNKGPSQNYLSSSWSRLANYQDWVNLGLQGSYLKSTMVAKHLDKIYKDSKRLAKHECKKYRVIFSDF